MAQWKSCFTCGLHWSPVHILHIYSHVLVKFCITYLQKVLLNIGELRENRHGEPRSFLVRVNAFIPISECTVKPYDILTIKKALVKCMLYVTDYNIFNDVFLFKSFRISILYFDMVLFYFLWAWCSPGASSFLQ